MDFPIFFDLALAGLRRCGSRWEMAQKKQTWLAMCCSVVTDAKPGFTNLMQNEHYAPYFPRCRNRSASTSDRPPAFRSFHTRTEGSHPGTPGYTCDCNHPSPAIRQSPGNRRQPRIRRYSRFYPQTITALLGAPTKSCCIHNHCFLSPQPPHR
jgi:hypothetical protein